MKRLIILIIVFCCVCFACEKRELISTNDFILEVESDKTNIDTRTKTNADEDDSFAKIVFKATSKGIRDELPYTLSFKSVQGSLRTSDISGKVIVPSLSNQEFNAGDDIPIANDDFFSDDGFVVHYIADEGGEHYIEFVFEASNQEVKTANVGIEAYQMPIITDGFADLHYDYSPITLEGFNWYFVDLNVRLDNSVLDVYTIEVKCPKLDVSQDCTEFLTDSNEVAGSYARLLPNHNAFYFLPGPAVMDPLKLIDKNIRIRILDSKGRESDWFTTRFRDAQDDG